MNPESDTEQKIYTTGYTGKDVNDLKPLLEMLDAMLIDIRFAPFSRIFHWRKVYLKALLGERYRHIANLGNRTYKEDKVTIQNLELGIKTILNLPTDIVLMCACDREEKCHRRIIVEKLNEQGIKTIQINDWKSREFPVQENLF